MSVREAVQWVELHHRLLRDARKQAERAYRLARLLGGGLSYDEAREQAGLSPAEGWRAVDRIVKVARAMRLGDRESGS